MKKLIVPFFIIFFSNALYANESRNHHIASSVCKLALENIELLRMSEESEPWFRNSTAAFNLNLTRRYVDRLSGFDPILNQKYFRTKAEFLSYIYSYSKANMKDDLSHYVIASNPPILGESLMSYLSDLIRSSVETFHAKSSDTEASTLTSINQLLNAMTAQSNEAVPLLLSELEVDHPKEFVDLKKSGEIHTIFNLRGEMERLMLEVERVRNMPGPPSPRLPGLIEQKLTVINTFTVRRTALFNRLLKEGKKEEFIAAEAMLGSEMKF